MTEYTQFSGADDLENKLRAHPSAAVAVRDHAADVAAEPTLHEKIDYLYTQAKAIEELVAAAGPLLAQAGPMLESLSPLLGRANSPAGRIFGAFL